MSHQFATIIVLLLFVVGCFILGRWSRRKGKQNIETLAWLIGGLSALLGIFAILGLMLTYLQ